MSWAAGESGIPLASSHGHHSSPSRLLQTNPLLIAAPPCPETADDAGVPTPAPRTNWCRTARKGLRGAERFDLGDSSLVIGGAHGLHRLAGPPLGHDVPQLERLLEVHE